MLDCGQAERKSFRLRNLRVTVCRWLHDLSSAFAEAQGQPVKEPPFGRGGRPGITLEDVRKACESLQRQGRVIGPVNVRLQLGRGSYETIQRHLRTLGFSKPSEESPPEI